MDLPGNFGGYLIVVFFFIMYMVLVGYSRVERRLSNHEGEVCRLYQQYLTITFIVAFQLALAFISTAYMGLLLCLSDIYLDEVIQEYLNNPEDD